MITVHLTVIAFSGETSSHVLSMYAVPRIHELVRIGGRMYRVEDITHEIESNEIHLRAVA